MPASLQMALDEGDPIDSGRPARVPTPYRWSTPALSSAGRSARAEEKKKIDFSQIRLDYNLHPARWPAPAIGRKISLPVDRQPEMITSIKNVASEPVPELPLKQT